MIVKCISISSLIGCFSGYTVDRLYPADVFEDGKVEVRNNFGVYYAIVSDSTFKEDSYDQTTKMFNECFEVVSENGVEHEMRLNDKR